MSPSHPEDTILSFFLQFCEVCLSALKTMLTPAVHYFLESTSICWQKCRLHLGKLISHNTNIWFGFPEKIDRVEILNTWHVSDFSRNLLNVFMVNSSTFLNSLFNY